MGAQRAFIDSIMILSYAFRRHPPFLNSTEHAQVEETHPNMPPRPSPEQNLQADIDKIKDPTPYKDKYDTEREQHLRQAIDILDRLKREAFEHRSGRENDPTYIAYEQLLDAQIYLLGLLHDLPEWKNRRHQE